MVLVRGLAALEICDMNNVPWTAKNEIQILIALLCTLCCFTFTAKTSAASAIPPPKPAKSDVLVGAYYFPGWSREQSWYCVAANNKVQHPLLSYYREGDPNAADWHIKWALEHGISFFAFDFYTQGGTQMLETALDDGFLKSRFINRFHFCLNWCNHAPASTMTEQEMEHFTDIAISKYMKHPSYLRINGKPVVMILAGTNFVNNLGAEKAKRMFDEFKNRCRTAGLNGVYLVFCEGGVNTEQQLQGALKAGADAFCFYNYPYAGTDLTGPTRGCEASYADLIQKGEGLWAHWRKQTGGKFWPTVMPGWDRRPWTKNIDLVRTGSTPELFEKSLRASLNYLNSDKVVLVEAWNEWGEGSVVEPSVERGFSYLDAVRSVFCPSAGPHKDESPKSLGMRSPAFNLKLPKIDTWRFDVDTMGWTSVRTSELRAESGALQLSTTNTDPQLTSPPTYIDCSRYDRAYIRMMASKSSGNASGTSGRLYWSTIDSMLNDDASVGFSVPVDGCWHEYEINLKSNPRWTGTVDRLRLDPVETEGILVRIDELCLLPAIK